MRYSITNLRFFFSIRAQETVGCEPVASIFAFPLLLLNHGVFSTYILKLT